MSIIDELTTEETSDEGAAAGDRSPGAGELGSTA
jgi:hypothetical protein